MWFEGSVAEAITASRQEGKPLLVLLTGFDQSSRMVQDALIEQAGEEHVEGCIALCLEDDLGNTDRSAFADAKNFRTFCPVDRLPSVVMVSPGGAVLAQVSGVVPAAELRSRLASAFAGFRRQQQQQLAQAALVTALASSNAAAAAAMPATAAAGAAASAAGPAPAAASGAEPNGGGGDEDIPPLDEPDAAAEGDDNDSDMPRIEEITSEDMRAFEAAAAAAAPPPPPPPVDPATVPYQLQFKFTDGGSFRAGFNGATLLRDVFAAVDEARSARGFRRHLAYLLVQTAPRLQLGAADEERCLADTGVQPRTSLQVIPHAALGHQPPQPPQPEPEPQQEQQVADEQPPAEVAEKQQSAAASAAAAEEQQPAARAAPAPAPAPAPAASAAPKAVQQQQQQQQAAPAPAPAPPPPPAEVVLQVRLSNSDSIRHTFPGSSLLSDVLDWVDANRTDRGAYKLSQTFPARTFFSGDLGKSLQDLGFEARTALQLELLPPAAKRSKFSVAPPPPAAAQPAAAPSQAAQAPPPPPPGGFALQLKLLNGEALRGSFPPEAVLQEVAHYVDTHRTDGGAPYHLVQPFPRRRFTADDMQTPLAQLGFEPRQALLLEPAAEQGRGGGWSLGGLLATAKSWLNPYSYVTGPAGTAGGGQEGGAAGGAAGSAQQRGGGNVHTLHDGGEAQDGSGRRDEGNSYWNGNSTEFGAGPPPGQQ